MKIIVENALKLLCCALAMLTNGCAFGQTNVWTHPWAATIKVVDENGQPVAGAEVDISYYIKPPPGENEAGESVHGLTDTNGIVRLSHAATGSVGLSFQATKAGYYSTTRGHEFAKFQDNNPDKWNPSETLLLKKVGKPIAMYAKRIDQNPPILGQPVGYDLMIGDWVGPNGKGVNADIIFQKEAYRKSGSDYEYKVKVTFQKAGDGVQVYTIPDSDRGSDLRSPHEAPLDGYQPEINKERSAHPGQPTKNNYDSNVIYLFRVRTAVDDRGNIVSAHYGKIYGDFMQFSYYLNPTPSDRNIEFDPKQNLLGGLDSLERVTAP